MYTVTSFNVGTVLCGLVLLAGSLYLGYWIQRLAVRHALRDVGVRGFVVHGDAAPPRLGPYGQPPPAARRRPVSARSAAVAERSAR